MRVGRRRHVATVAAAAVAITLIPTVPAAAAAYYCSPDPCNEQENPRPTIDPVGVLLSAGNGTTGTIQLTVRAQCPASFGSAHIIVYAYQLTGESSIREAGETELYAFPCTGRVEAATARVSQFSDGPGFRAGKVQASATIYYGDQSRYAEIDTIAGGYTVHVRGSSSKAGAGD